MQTTQTMQTTQIMQTTQAILPARILLTLRAPRIPARIPTTTARTATTKKNNCREAGTCEGSRFYSTYHIRSLQTSIPLFTEGPYGRERVGEPFNNVGI
jgi:hypothetical protein